jgi:carbonic anhydrase
MIDYGYLMMLVDSDNRYVYKGSVTTPPCGQSVYWNVMSTVYPIKQAHVDLFKAQLARADQGDLADTGNWREIQTVDEHNVIKVSTGEDSATKIAMGLISAASVVAMTLF